MAVASFGVGCVLLGISHWLWLSMALMAVTGYGLMYQVVATNTIVQTIVDDDKRGRVMSFYTHRPARVGADRQPARRIARGADRRGGHVRGERRCVRAGDGVVLAAAAGDSHRHPAALRRARHPPRRPKPFGCLRCERIEGNCMLKLFTLLRPFRSLVSIVMVLALAQSLANLYLPRLMADIVDHGIVPGDTATDPDIGGLMLLMARARHRLRGGGQLLLRRRWPPASAASSASASSNACRALLGAPVRPLQHRLADHADHQRHHAGAAGADACC